MTSQAQATVAGSCTCCTLGCRFIAALTRGGPGGMPRPIEMHAHNPRRYIGDMLAWVHQSLASERELLMALFGDRQPAEEGGGEMPSTALLLDKVFQSICRPLKVGHHAGLMVAPGSSVLASA